MPGAFPERAGLHDAQLIGSGGFADVYRATHDLWGEVAVKVARESHPETIKQFKQEFKILRSLRHAGVCRVHNLCWSDTGRPFLVMQLLAGGDLYVHCDPLPIAERFRSLDTLLGGIDYLHHLGIVHRDLKGENILFDSEGRPVVTDLGLAVAEEDCSRSGTLDYMAPEIVDNQPATAAADIYSLGVILYRLASGRLPFEASNAASLISQKHKPDFHFLERLPDELPGRFRDTILRCLQPETEARFKSVSQIAEQLTLSGLLPNRGRVETDLQPHWHHHLRAYNFSWVKQNIKSLEQDYLIADHRQSQRAGLQEAISDYLKLESAIVESTRDELRYRKPDSTDWHTISITSNPTEPGVTLDYPEPDMQAVGILLTKILSGGIDSEVVELIYGYTDGNLNLICILLQSWEQDGYIRAALGGAKLDLPVSSELALPRAYYDSVKGHAPEVPEELRSSLTLLAAERFAISARRLSLPGVLPQEQIVSLQELGVLKRESVSFKSSYLREFYYHQASVSERVAAHRRWLDLLEHDAELDLTEKERRLFEHNLALQDSEATIQVALSLTRRLWRNNEPVLARRLVARVRRMPTLERSGEPYLRLLMRAADLAKDAGDSQSALSDYAKLARLAHQEKQREILAETYKDLGDIYKAKCDYGRGLRVLERAALLYHELDDELEISHCLNNMGNIHWLSGDLKEAADYYKSALEIQKRLDAKRDIASTSSNLGSVLCVQQDFDEGIPLQKQAIALNREINELGQAARTANNLAVSYLWIDQLELARRYLEDSLQINRSLGAEKEMLYNYENLGEVQTYLGDYAAARDALLEGLRLAPADAHSHRSAMILRLAEIFLQTGRYHKATALLEAASRGSEQVTDSLLFTDLALLRCRLALLLKQFEPARKNLNQAFKQIEKLGDRKKKANLLMLALRWQLDSGAPSQGMAARLGEIRDLLETLQIEREWLLYYLDETEIELKGGNLEAAQAALRSAENRPDFDGRQLLEPRLRYLQGLLGLAQGNSQGALKSLELSSELAESVTNKELQWQIRAAIGDAYLQMRNYERAMQSFISAFATLKELAGTIADASARKSYLSDPQKLKIAEKLEELRALTV